MHWKKKILVVDDEALLCVTKELLEDERYEIIAHHGGLGVIDLVRQLQPDLVLLDINMPVLSGENLALLLRSCLFIGTGHTRIVFYSSNDEDSLRKSVLECDAHGYICKGDIVTLRKKVNQYLGLPL